MLEKALEGQAKTLRFEVKVQLVGFLCCRSFLRIEVSRRVNIKYNTVETGIKEVS